jgi:hypothetical protein
LLERVFRDEWGRVLAALVRSLGDVELAEEAAQDAFAAAAERWPRDGEPANPMAWLITTGRNRAIDKIRRDRTLAGKTRLLAVPEATEENPVIATDTPIPDERLELMPDEPEVHGLLALMRILHARAGARFADGEPVLLADQDRTQWDRDLIAAGRAGVERGHALRGRGPPTPIPREPSFSAASAAHRRPPTPTAGPSPSRPVSRRRGSCAGSWPGCDAVSPEAAAPTARCPDRSGCRGRSPSHQTARAARQGRGRVPRRGRTAAPAAPSPDRTGSSERCR